MIFGLAVLLLDPKVARDQPVNVLQPSEAKETEMLMAKVPLVQAVKGRGRERISRRRREKSVGSGGKSKTMSTKRVKERLSERVGVVKGDFL